MYWRRQKTDLGAYKNLWYSQLDSFGDQFLVEELDLKVDRDLRLRVKL